MRVLFKMIVGLAVAALLALAVLLLHDFEAPWIAEAVARAAASRSVDLEVEHAAFDLRRGFLLEGVTARTRAAGESLEASVERLVLEHRLWPLLAGRVVVDRLRLERPVVEMISAPPRIGAGTRDDLATAPGGAAGDTTPAGRLRLEIGEVAIEQGSWVSRAEGGAGVSSVEGLEVTLRDLSLEPGTGTPLLALSAHGWLEASDLAVGPYGLSGVATSITVERGLYRLDAFEARARSAGLHVETIELDLAQSPYRYRFAMLAEAIDLGRFLGPVEGLGTARLELRCNGEGPGLGGAVAEMSLTLEAGRLPSTPVLERVDRLAGTSLDGAAHEPVELQVSLASGDLDIDTFEVVTEIARLELGGSISAAGTLDLAVGVGLPRERFDDSGISAAVLDLLTSRSQWLTLPLRVSGTADEPRFAPDMEALGAAVRHLGAQAAESLRETARSELSSAIVRRLGP